MRRKPARIRRYNPERILPSLVVTNDEQITFLIDSETLRIRMVSSLLTFQEIVTYLLLFYDELTGITIDGRE